MSTPSRAVPAEPGTGRTVLVAVAVVVTVAATGLATGWLWALVAPRLDVIKGDGGFYYAQAEPEQPVAAEGWFLAISLAAGVVLTVLAWLTLRRFRGPAILVALAIGALGASWLAWWWGVRIGHAEFVAAKATAGLGDHIAAPLKLRITSLDAERPWQPQLTGVVAVQSLVSVFTYAILAGWSRFASLRGPDPAPNHPAPSHPAPDPPALDPPEHSGDAQFGLGRAGNSDTDTGTART